MSDPQAPLNPRPARAAPLPPDRPGSGEGAQPSPEKSVEELAQAAEAKQREQAKTALENTCNGYG